MSVKVSSWVWHEARDKNGNEVSGNELVLMLALADVADDRGRCRYVDDESGLTYDTLAEKVRVSKRTVIRMVAALRAAGLIDQTKGVKGRPNEFRVVVPWVAISGDNLAPNDDSGSQDSVTSATDSVTDDAVFGDNSNTRSSYRRDRSSDVSTSAVETATTTGQRFAQPLCDVLVAELQRNEVKVPSPVPKKWLDDARLMVDRDGRDPHQAKALIEWACRDSFWRSNIQSMPTFRKQYDRLRLQAGRARGGQVSKVDQGRAAHEELLRRQREGGQRAVAS